MLVYHSLHVAGEGLYLASVEVVSIQQFQFVRRWESCLRMNAVATAAAKSYE